MLENVVPKLPNTAIHGRVKRGEVVLSAARQCSVASETI
jgi:hypothetical protein